MTTIADDPSLEALRYPVGRKTTTLDASPAQRRGWIDDIALFPERLTKVVLPMSDERLDTPYRPGGWTVRQVVHHVPDSHANGYIRFCLALTEDNPTIRPYEEQLWAELPFSRRGPIAPSLAFLAGVHARWVPVLEAAGEAELKRPWTHPAEGITYRAGDILELYAWHARHHLAHVTGLVERMGW